MTKPTPMTDDRLKALTDSELRNSVGYYGGKLAEQRRRAEYYYLGLPKGDLAPPEIEGRSQVVSTDVRNTIEAMLPQLMVKFTGGDIVVEFEPTKPGDEQKAQQCTDYLNHLFFKKNNGHQICYTWFKDALLQKRGILKVWWDTRNEETREEYQGLDPIELAQLADDKELEITEQNSYPDEEDAEQRKQALQQLQQQLDQALNAAQQGNQQAAAAIGQIQAHMQAIVQTPPALLYDVVCKRTKKGGKVCIENVPPEEFLISRKAKMDIQSSPFVGHRFARTLSELRSMGYKNVDAIEGDDAAVALNMERVERLGYDDEQAYLNIGAENTDESQRIVWVTECYLRCDYDGDGIAELRKVTRAGNQILDNEVVDIIPFVSICPVPMPHKFFGLSIADLAMEQQLANTAVERAIRDNLYLEVNGRYVAVEGQVNLDDLLTSRPGGVVRAKNREAVGRLDQGKGNISEAMGLLEYGHQRLEDSTGWSRNSQGNDPTALNDSETATKTRIVANKADMRLDLIARNFAEGFVDLFRMMLKLVCQYQDRHAELKIAGQWVSMDPREWRNQFDVSISVGLGMGDKDQRAAHLMTLTELQGKGLAIGIATPENIYNCAIEFAKNVGFKNGDKFFTKPDPNNPPPNPAAQEMQAKVQGQLQIEQGKAQIKAQTDQQKIMADAEGRAHQAQLDATLQAHLQEVQAQQNALQNHLEAQRAQQQAMLEAQLEAQRIAADERLAQLQNTVDLLIAHMNNAAKIEVAETTAGTTLQAAQISAANKAQPDQASE
jgi:soluble cytochrome b562